MSSPISTTSMSPSHGIDCPFHHSPMRDPCITMNRTPALSAMSLSAPASAYSPRRTRVLFFQCFGFSPTFPCVCLFLHRRPWNVTSASGFRGFLGRALRALCSGYHGHRVRAFIIKEKGDMIRDVLSCRYNSNIAFFVDQ